MEKNQLYIPSFSQWQKYQYMNGVILNDMDDADEDK